MALAALGIILTQAGAPTVLAQTGTAGGSTQAPGPAFWGTPVVPERTIPGVALVNQYGEPAAAHDPFFRVTFVLFGTTHCLAACPLALATLAKTYRGLDAPNDVRIEMISVDPARDTPDALEGYVHAFHRRFWALTGSKVALDTLYKAFDVPGAPRTREAEHGAAIYLVDDRARILVLYPPNVSPRTLEHDARLLLAKP